MDETGADAVTALLRRCDVPRKVVIARPDARGIRHYARFAARIEAAGGEVREYWLPRTGTEGPAAETFHAKLVMADTNLVYVGSSNLMASSLDGGLECGVLLEGRHATPFCRIVEAVLAISRPLAKQGPRLSKICLRRARSVLDHAFRIPRQRGLLHPRSIKARSARTSRAMLRSNFSAQNERFDAGVVAFMHPVCRCQKHPWTNMHVRSRG